MSVSRLKWEAFCDTLKQAGELLTADGVPQDEQTQAEGLRYLSRIARAALEWYVAVSYTHLTLPTNREV